MIRSEINPLKKVIIHSPGIEHHYTLPENTFEWTKDKNGKMIHNPDYLLFDDLISPSQMNDEHSQLVTVLKSYTGDNHTIQFCDLLMDVVDNNAAKSELLDQCLFLDSELYKTDISMDKNMLLDLDSPQFLNVILSGRWKNDHIQPVLKWPLPNLIFTRDIAVMIGNTVLLTWAKRNVRKREMLLTKFIFQHHPLLKNIPKFDFHKFHPNLSIEGGDIIIFDDSTLFIGLSERNSKEAIDSILPLCYEKGFDQIIVVDLPKTRTIMHLDTIFSRISETDILVYPPLFHQKVIKGQPISFYYLEKNQSIFDGIPEHHSLEHCLKYLGFNMNPVYCGGNEPIFQEREQWSDGANAFTLEPGKIISYARNHETLKELEKSGYKSVDAVKFCTDKNRWLSYKGKLTITIDSAELPRGRGGPRCLTLPMDRA
ncbi:MAG: arginine deiminase family protein [Candidatus Marinimicrobia bacterium]|nr:arginine deiminase family protein [Candidatus Neomarinimicrobiota bacterium]